MSTAIIVPNYGDKDLKQESEFGLKCLLADAKKVQAQITVAHAAAIDRVNQIERELQAREEVEPMSGDIVAKYEYNIGCHRYTEIIVSDESIAKEKKRRMELLEEYCRMFPHEEARLRELLTHPHNYSVTYSRESKPDNTGWTLVLEIDRGYDVIVIRKQ